MMAYYKLLIVISNFAPFDFYEERCYTYHGFLPAIIALLCSRLAFPGDCVMQGVNKQVTILLHASISFARPYLSRE